MPDNHMFAGTAAGIVTAVLLHPVDVVKVRFQVQDGVARAVTYRHVLPAFVEIVKNEGVKGLYRGVTAAAAGSGASWGLYFYLYEMCKRRLTPTTPESSSTATPRVPTWVNMYAAWEAGALTCLATNPLWLIKTRLQLQTGTTAAEIADRPYRGMADAFVRIVREEGVLALYKGLLPALALTFHGSIQFGVYEEMKHLLAGPLQSPGASAYLFAIGAMSKIAATTATYPFQVVKARLQQRFALGATPEYTGVADCARKILLREGPVGFYKGFVANLIRVTPQSALTLVTYEEVRALLRYTNPAGEPAQQIS